MKLEVKELTDRKAVLIVREVDHSFVNAIRRTMLADVPKLAIDDVTIYDNTSALFDEILSHRLGLLPVPTEPGLFNFRDSCPACKGEGCPSCTVLFTLSKEGPGMVVSGDLTPADPKFAIPDPDIPIVKLLEGQRVMLEAAAILGTGTTHAKWNAVVAVGYRELPSVKISGTIPGPLASEIERLAPPNSIRIQDNRIQVIDEEKAHDFLKGALEKWDVPGVELKEDPRAFRLMVETDGGLTAKQALQQAVQMLMEKLKYVEETVPKLLKEA